ncbi:MAG TPA: ABC transporter substrate-binding protein [Stellaceae bacterium]|nr:ABC transporter substrate-binding protein [Stellaceae bacterium]
MRRAGLAAALAILGWAAAASADPLPLRVGWAQAPSQLTALSDELMKRHPAMFPYRGKSYALEPVRFQGSTQQIQGLASGELEIASLGPSSLALAVINAHLDLRIVADVMQDGVPGHFATYWVVRKDGPVKSFADMRHRRVAINAFGATTDMVLRETLRKNGVADSDYVVIEANFANMLAMMENDKIDLVPVMPQFSHDFEATGHYRSLFNNAEIVGPSEVGMWAIRADFIAAHRPALVDFLEDDMRSVRWFLDPANREEALAIAGAVTKESRAALDYVFGPGDLYHSPDLLPIIPSVQKDIDQAVAMKLLPARIVVDPAYVDLSLVADAKARLDGK